MRKPKHIRDAEKARVNDIILGNAGVRHETSKGYRLSPSPKTAHRISLHPGKGAGRNAKFLQTLDDVEPLSSRFVSLADKGLNDKQRQTKYKDQILNCGNDHTKVKVKHTDNRCMVKVGMTKPRKLFITDKETGEEVFIKIPAKPKYKEVGLP